MTSTVDAMVHYISPMSKPGWIEVICGCMFSGKTEELIRRLRRAEIAKKNIQVFKPVIDNRYDESDIMTHTSSRLRAFPIISADKILTMVKTSTEVVGIDEAQFFGEDLVPTCQQLADSGHRVIVAMLDMDSNANPFGSTPNLMAVAEQVTKLSAICMRCGESAHRTRRIAGGAATIEIGGADKYEARCRRCFNL